MIRKPVVAGAFYPGSSKVLKNQITEFMNNAPIDKEYKNILGIISPHAGYIYSGQCAAYGFNVLKQKDFDLAVVIAPSHRFGSFRYSVGSFDAYTTPLGEVSVDTELTEALLKSDEFDFHDLAHNSEHSLEVQLPFLQMVNPNTKILPILLGSQSAKNSQNLSKVLSELFKERLEKTVFIISSDLSHYHDKETASKMDLLLAENVEKNDIEELEKNINFHNVEACGFGGILTLLHLAKILGYNKIETLKYTHSGDVSGDYSQVVGYLSSIVYK